MIFEGREYKPGKDGNYRCPRACHDPEYPAPKWKTEAGFAKHLDGCREWVKPAPPPKVRFSECADCTGTIWEGEAFWAMLDKVVCLDCHEEYHEAGRGHLEVAGLEFPELTLEG